MLTLRVLRRAFARGHTPSLLPSLVLGLAAWIASPAQIAYQDMASFVSGAETGSARWGAFVERSVAGSVHQAEMPFVDRTVTGGISGGGLRTPEIGMVAFRAKGGAAPTPDEDRVNRGEKRGRLLQVAPVAPPRHFNAGSVFERRSSLMRMETDPDLRMAFVVPQISGREVQIAGTFHIREERPEVTGVSAMLASLVNNDRPDILATAYAPAAPDYAASSPFASLLREEDDGAHGRFIPPLDERDHAWMAKPLPPSVFEAKEQKCLAEGIYFEARSENLKGQAAVAQVILNRVRNPTYPDTICGVVYQNRTWRNRCQFSFACEGKALRIGSPRHYEIAEEIAMAVTAGKIFLPEVGSATHYHATYVNPGWARTMERVKKIGLHIFYRTYGGGWS